MICLAIEKPLTYVEVLKEKIKEEISNIEVNLIIFTLIEIYFKKENLITKIA